MALGTIRIQGGDTTARNIAGGAWKVNYQFTTAPTFLTKLVVFVPSAIGGNRVLWLLDTAAGESNTPNPVAVLVCPNGFTTTLDFGDYGKIFTQGLFVIVATNEPTDPTTTALVSADNDAMVTIDYKVK
jgi:hypothetical protein